MKPGGERADDLPPVGEPERERIEDRAGAERGDEGVDLRDLDEEAVEQARRAPRRASTSRIASGQGTPYMTCRPIARMCHMTMPKPTVRSMRPAIIGTIAASDSSAMIALSARIERKLR